MTPALIAALVFTVILLAITAYFLMGALPLLILKHDTPMDARFVRGFFDTYYLAVIWAAGAASLSYALAGRFVFASGAAVLGTATFVLRRRVMQTMDALRAALRADDAGVIRAFRRTHLAAIFGNLVQLVLIVGSLVAFPLQ
jgi:hypothetical protein